MSGRARIFLLMTAVAVASAVLFWLLREHWRHAFGMAPYLLSLACPVMHYFMHGGHAHGNSSENNK